MKKFNFQLPPHLFCFRYPQKHSFRGKMGEVFELHMRVLEGRELRKVTVRFCFVLRWMAQLFHPLATPMPFPRTLAFPMLLPQ